MFHVPEPYRLRGGPMATDRTYGNNGAFAFRSVIAGRNLAVIASDGAEWKASGLEGEPWEHVSVHVYQGKKEYTPTWIEMCQAKDMFWDKDDLVIQFHPRESDYVNNHAHTLHLWRPIGQEIPAPPPLTVGLKDAGTITTREQAAKLVRDVQSQIASESSRS